MALALAGVVAGDLCAQTAGVPVPFAPSRPDRLVLGAEVGAGHGAYVGLRTTWGGGIVGLVAAQGVFPSDGAWTAGASVSLHPIKGSERPLAVSLDGGVGYAARDGETGAALRQWDGFLGVGTAWESLTAVGDIEPWVAGRWHVRRATVTEPGGTRRGTDHGVGVSGGVRITLFQPRAIRGWGVHLAAERLFGIDPTPVLRFGDPRRPVFSAGLHRRF